MKRGYNGSHFRRLFFWRENRVPNCLSDRSPVKSADTGYANCRWRTSYFCTMEFTGFALKSRQDERAVSRRVSNKRDKHRPVILWDFVAIKYTWRLKSYDWFTKTYKCNIIDFSFNSKYKLFDFFFHIS